MELQAHQWLVLKYNRGSFAVKMYLHVILYLIIGQTTIEQVVNEETPLGKEVHLPENKSQQ